MSGVTTYRFLEESDSAAAADLLTRNRFFFGGLDPALTAERYDLVQKMKGLIFGVCAEMDSEMIAMICAYRAGADRTASVHQVFVSALLVDAAHRTKLYSFMQLYRMLLVHIRETMPQVRELVMEVYRENLQSLYMQRMFGSVITDGSMPNPEEIFMRNYGPALQRLFLPMWETTHQKLETALLPFDKKKVREVTPLTEGRLVTVTNIVDGTRMDISCNVFSGCACRVRAEQEFYAGLEGDGFFLENLSDEVQTWSLRPWDQTGDRKEEVPGSHKAAAAEAITVIAAPGERIHTDGGDVVIALEGTTKAFHLKAGEDWTFDPFNPEPAAEPADSAFSLKKKTGLLAACDGGRVCFQEVWTYVTSPYLFGTVIPDPERKIAVRETGIHRTDASETRRGFRLERRYEISAGEAAIQTTAYLDGGSEEAFSPVFALHLQDMNGSVEFRLKSGEAVARTFDYVRDLKLAHDEVILYEFVHESYAEQEISGILLHFEGVSWKVTTDRPFRAYLHCNYIFLRPLDKATHPGGWAWTEGKAEFGSIRIEKMEEG